jgi:hypothetical protein
LNYINKIREEIKKDFNEVAFKKGDSETSLSPTNSFRIDATNFFSKEPNWDLTKVEVYNQGSSEKILEFFVNESSFFYSWLLKDNKEYLICAEDIFGGQTVIDLDNAKLEGYSPNEEGFIWTSFHLSPDGKTLATIGCYWACPYIIKLFDFSDPMALPLKEIKEIELLDNDEIILAWIDNQTFKTSGIRREKEWEYFEGGSMRMKTLSEEKVERLININGA